VGVAQILMWTFTAAAVACSVVAARRSWKLCRRIRQTYGDTAPVRTLTEMPSVHRARNGTLTIIWPDPMPQDVLMTTELLSEIIAQLNELNDMKRGIRR
jgi:hypothetical protein